jgi:hypothetical protein
MDGMTMPWTRCCSWPWRSRRGRSSGSGRPGGSCASGSPLSISRPIGRVFPAAADGPRAPGHFTNRRLVGTDSSVKWPGAPPDAGGVSLLDGSVGSAGFLRFVAQTQPSCRADQRNCWTVPYNGALACLAVGLRSRKPVVLIGSRARPHRRSAPLIASATIASTCGVKVPAARAWTRTAGQEGPRPRIGPVDTQQAMQVAEADRQFLSRGGRQPDARAGPFGLLDETPQDGFACPRHRPGVVIGLVRGGRVLHVVSPDLSSRSEQIQPTVPPNRPAGHCV